MPLTTARDEVHERSLAPTMTITEKGLVLGATVLIPIRDVDGAPELAVDGAEERIMALLAIVYGGKVGARVLGNIRRASQNWRKREKTLAAIELALSGLPPLLDQPASVRLSLGERLLDEGLSPHELIKACGLDPTLLDLVKGYNPDQPRVPAGNPDGGQWTGDGDPKNLDPDDAAPTPLLPINYTPVHELPLGARFVVPPDGVPIPDKDSPTKNLMAPPYADFRQVYQAGQAIASLPLAEQYRHTRAAIGQEGAYDFQRDVANQKFYDAYTPAANYAVGVYMAGTGYSLDTTRILAKLYALRYSRNYNAQDQLDWIKRGWTDAKTGRWQ